MASTTGQNVTIGISADDNTRRAFSGIKRNLKTTSKEADGLSHRFRNMARATAAIEGPLGGTAGRLSVIATLLGSSNVAMVAFSAAIAGMTAVAISSIKHLGDYEEQLFKVQQMLLTTGNASGLTANQINEMADSIGLATLQSRNGVLEASAVLLSFKSIAGDSFRSTMEVAADMSALMGTDLKSSVTILGKALEDPIRNLGALNRNGISFNATQTEMIKKFSKAGDAAKAQAAILEVLTGQLGGAGAAAGAGVNGAIDALSHGWDKWMVQLADTSGGKTATDVLHQIARGFNNTANSMDDTHDTLGKTNKAFAELVIINKEIQQIRNSDRGGQAGRLISLESEKVSVSERLTLLITMNKTEASAQIAATASAKASKERLKTEAALVAEKAKQLKIDKEAAATLKKDKSGAQKFIEQLNKQSQVFNDSLLSKEEKEDAYLARRIAKINDNVESEFITQQEGLDAALVAYQLHEDKKSVIKADSDVQQNESEDDKHKNALSATRSAFGVGATLMAAQSKKLFKLGKAAAIAEALVNTYLGVTKTMAAVPYPFNIPLAALQLAAGLVQVQNIKSQQFSGAREFGGSVIGNRSYLVGERGPELFTPSRTGQIINNNTTNNLAGGGGGERTVNVNISAMDTQSIKTMFEDNRSLLFNTVVEGMNEEGASFA